MENGSGDPWIEAGDGEAERPIGLEEAVGECAGAGGGADRVLGGVGQFTGIDLGNVFPVHGAHLEAAVRDDGDDAGFAGGLKHRDARGLPGFLRAGWAPGEGEVEIELSQGLAVEVEGDDALAVGGGFGPVAEGLAGGGLDLEAGGDLRCDAEHPGAGDRHGKVCGDDKPVLAEGNQGP